MKTCPKKVKIVWHFAEDDKDCSHDFYAVDMWFDKEKVLNLGDDYHDQSDGQIRGFLAACKLIWPEFPKVEVVNKNDWEC